ncbi:unnamed protein product [Ranitomeya imitator]|uniref:Gamma-glutamylcyclotransferase n=1 Tax=Ranitomeya imitator TaxID=111125 RepID=A0ABN9LR24_9NEOB|nr:unnamed protein product [Ranitomeya imitator]
MRPLVRKSTPPWDLNLVLNTLCKTPYLLSEDMNIANLSFKTAFLIAITSAKRLREMQALSIQNPYLQIFDDRIVFKLNPAFLPKDCITAFYSIFSSQEGVAVGIYQPIEINVQTADGELVCRCYKMNKCIYGLTSPQYKQVMCMGAKQNDLPPEYQKMLGELQTNNYSGPIAIMDILKEAIQKVQDD